MPTDAGGRGVEAELPKVPPAGLVSRADAHWAIAELLGERIAAVLADLALYANPPAKCWTNGECRVHAECLAARIRTTLAGEEG